MNHHIYIIYLNWCLYLNDIFYIINRKKRMQLILKWYLLYIDGNNLQKGIHSRYLNYSRASANTHYFLYKRNFPYSLVWSFFFLHMRGCIHHVSFFLSPHKGMHWATQDSAFMCTRLCLVRVRENTLSCKREHILTQEVAHSYVREYPSQVTKSCNNTKGKKECMKV